MSLGGGGLSVDWPARLHVLAGGQAVCYWMVGLWSGCQLGCLFGKVRMVVRLSAW